MTKEDALRLIGKMQKLYGAKFTAQWAGVETDDLADELILALGDLSISDIRHGFARMLTEAWPPTVPQLRKWCEQGGDWLTADEAWVAALAHDASGGRSVVTIATHSALAAVRQVMTVEGQKAAAWAFKDVYARAVSDLKKSGGVQVNYVPPAKIDKPKNNVVADHAAAHALLAKMKADMKK